MERHTLKLIALLSLVCIGLAFAIVWTAASAGPGPGILLAAGLVGAAFVGVRSMLLVSRLRRCLRQMLAGTYDVVLKPTRPAYDEAGQLTRLFNRFTGQLKTYDSLRADRVRVAHRSLEALADAVPSAALIIDVGRQTLRMNPAFREQTRTSQTSISMESVSLVPANAEFMSLFETVVLKQKTSREAIVPLRLPVQDTAERYAVRMIPVKNRDDLVQQVVVTVDAA